MIDEPDGRGDGPVHDFRQLTSLCCERPVEGGARRKCNVVVERRQSLADASRSRGRSLPSAGNLRNAEDWFTKKASVGGTMPVGVWFTLPPLSEFGAQDR